MPQYKISDILSLTAEDLVGLTRSQALSYYRQAKSFAEQRYKRAMASPESNLIVVELKVKPIPVEQMRDVSRARLISKIRAYQSYLSKIQTSIDSSKAYRTWLIGQIKEQTGITITKAQYDDFWDVYKGTRKDFAESNVTSKYELWRKIEQTMDELPKNLTVEDLIDIIKGRLAPTKPQQTQKGQKVDYNDNDALTIQRNPFG